MASIMAPGENKPLPIWLTFVVCDDVIKDATTGKASLMGIFANVNATKFPAVHPKLCVYFELTDGRGSTPIEVVIVQEPDDKELGRLSMTFDFTDPQAVLAGVIQIGSVVFPVEGEYRFQLHAHGTPLVERRIIAKKVEP